MQYPNSTSGVVSEDSGNPRPVLFLPWQPTSWPVPNPDFGLFLVDLELIFEETILVEIENVIEDAQKVNGGLERRGHVVALALLCAVDTLSSYAFEGTETERCPECGRGDRVGPRYQKYIEDFFPDDYRSHAEGLYKLYRNSVVHSWNLFEVAIAPGKESIEIRNGILSFGLLNFFDALEDSVKNFIKRLDSDTELQEVCRKRYESLRLSAR